MAPDSIDLALRAWAVPELVVEERESTKRGGRADHPAWWLVFDTETRLDPGQALTFGVARLYRPRHREAKGDPGGRECFGEFWFYGEALTDHEAGVLEDLARALPWREYHGDFWNRAHERFETSARRTRLTEDGVPLVVLPRSAFVREVFVPLVRDARALVVGLNVPFDLSRLAASWGEARRPRRRRGEDGSLPARRSRYDSFSGGFSFKLAEGKGEGYLPRIVVKTIDAKRHLIALRRNDDVEDEADRATDRFHGHFLDLRTFAFALTNESYSLKNLARARGVVHQKLDHAPSGTVSREEVEYARYDVLATYESAESLFAEYAAHPVSPDHPGADKPGGLLQATKAYSPASIGKAYLRAMGVTPPLERGWAIGDERLGHAMTAFYGGRAECRLRRTAVPVTYVDFTSMYPTVNGLMRLWDVLTASDLRLIEATDAVRDLLAGVTLAGVFDAALWPSLRGFARVVPHDDILPTRGAYGGVGTTWQIGVNHLTSKVGFWYALPDLVAATLLGARPPRVLEAFVLEPSGRLPDLMPVALRGEVHVDPAGKDFFAAVIEERTRVRSTPGHDKALAAFLKVLANATSYGIFAETIRHDVPKEDPIDVAIHGLGKVRLRPLLSPEEPGAYAFPPLAALITAAARLMLALLERSVADAGGAYVFVDTDSMAIVSSETGGRVRCRGGPIATESGEAVEALSWAAVDAIRRRFDALNPYATGAVADILKLEDENFAPAPTVDDPTAVDKRRRLQLHAFAISAKRYALYNGDGDDVLIRKASEHGLGHLLNPDDPDPAGADRGASRAWIPEFWRALVLRSRGTDVTGPRFGERPAVTQTTASAPRLVRPFAAYNRARSPTEQVRPFNFVLSAIVARFGHPVGSDPRQFHLVARFERDPRKWLRLRWIDLYSGRSHAVTTGAPTSEAVALKSVGDVLAEYETHAERKSAAPDGRPASEATVGLLGRRHVVAKKITFIGKEANELTAVEEGQFHDLGEVVTDYGPEEDRWEEIVRPALAGVDTAAVAGAAGLSRRTVQRAVTGAARPHPRNVARLEAAAIELSGSGDLHRRVPSQSPK